MSARTNVITSVFSTTYVQVIGIMQKLLYMACIIHGSV